MLPFDVIQYIKLTRRVTPHALSVGVGVGEVVIMQDESVRDYFIIILYYVVYSSGRLQLIPSLKHC